MKKAGFERIRLFFSNAQGRERPAAPRGERSPDKPSSYSITAHIGNQQPVASAGDSIWKVRKECDRITMHKEMGKDLREVRVEFYTFTCSHRVQSSGRFQ